MLRSLYIPALMAIATLAMGYPSGAAPKPWDDGNGIQEIQLLERDAVFTASDMELAEKHGVDVNEVFKHTIIKRADGDDVTIWVHRNFTQGDPAPEQESELNVGQPGKRAPAAASDTPNHIASSSSPAVASVGENWKPIGPGKDGQRYCWEKPLSLVDITGPVSPLLASVKEIAIWGRQNSGFFAFGEFKPWVDAHDRWVNLVVAGAGQGTLARFAARWNDFGLIMLGPGDVSTVIDAVVGHFPKQYESTWRVAARGSISCPQRISTLIQDYGYGDIEFKIVRGG